MDLPKCFPGFRIQFENIYDQFIICSELRSTDYCTHNHSRGENHGMYCYYAPTSVRFWLRFDCFGVCFKLLCKTNDSLRNRIVFSHAYYIFLQLTHNIWNHEMYFPLRFLYHKILKEECCLGLTVTG